MENVLIATVLSFVVTYFSIPILIKVAELKHLYDEPDERKAHKRLGESDSSPDLSLLLLFAYLQ